MDEQFTFGKHGGKQFSQVAQTDAGYCKWALGLRNCTGGMLKFKQYLEATGWGGAATAGGEGAANGGGGAAAASQHNNTPRSARRPQMANPSNFRPAAPVPFVQQQAGASSAASQPQQPFVQQQAGGGAASSQQPFVQQQGGGSTSQQPQHQQASQTATQQSASAASQPAGQRTLPNYFTKQRPSAPYQNSNAQRPPAFQQFQPSTPNKFAAQQSGQSQSQQQFAQQQVRPPQQQFQQQKNPMQSGYNNGRASYSGQQQQMQQQQQQQQQAPPQAAPQRFDELTVCFAILNTEEVAISTLPPFTPKIVYSTIRNWPEVIWDPDKKLHVKGSDYKTVLDRCRNNPQFLCKVDPLPEWVVKAIGSTCASVGGRQLQNSCTAEEAEAKAENFLKTMPGDIQQKVTKYQKQGLQFCIKNGGRVLVGDEMGLGKTLQALLVSTYYKENWPVLIIAPSSLRAVWRAEAMKSSRNPTNEASRAS